jgi:hypothetical protein
MSAPTTFHADVDDYFEEDGFLDEAFSADEGLKGVHGLVSSIGAGRVPYDRILKPLGGLAKFDAGWAKRGAPVMAPIAVLNHWTGATPTLKNPAPCFKICRDGRPGVPGPLVPLLIGYDGIAHVLCSGRSNHAGKGNVAMLAEFKAGRIPTKTAAQRGLKDTGGSGGSLIGIEVEAPGNGRPLSDKQYDTWTWVLACIADDFKWKTERVAPHHALWTPRKIDFTSGKMPPWSLDKLIADVNAKRKVHV